MRSVVRYVRDLKAELDLENSLPACYLRLDVATLKIVYDSSLFVGYEPPPPKKPAWWAFIEDDDVTFPVRGHYALRFLHLLYARGFRTRLAHASMTSTTSHESFLVRGSESARDEDIVFIVRQHEKDTSVTDATFAKLCKKAVEYIQGTSSMRRKYVITVDYDLGLAYDTFKRLGMTNIDMYHPVLRMQKSYPLCIVDLSPRPDAHATPRVESMR